MSYNYPPEKLSIYLSDDGGSELTFYALLEASHFSKYWIPFCKKFMVEPRSPAAYFAKHSEPQDLRNAQEWLSIKKLHKAMENRIESAVEMGAVSKEIRNQHKGFSEWNPKVTKRDHQSIVKILIDGRETNAVDNDGCSLPTLVYMAREKRPQWPHNFKAGAMNALFACSKLPISQMGLEEENGTPGKIVPANEQEISEELEMKVKKYLRGEGANLEVLQDKKLKGQLVAREELYGKSAKATAKAEKTS